MGCIDRNNKFCCAPCMRLYPVVGPAGPAGGDGSQASPFQTIEEALAVAKPNSTINVFPGTYPISNQINLNIPGLILKGYAGSDILLENSVVLF